MSYKFTYIPDSLLFFPDVDECEEGTDNCVENATCENTIGSFTCECDDGFVGEATEECKGMVTLWLDFIQML